MHTPGSKELEQNKKWYSIEKKLGKKNPKSLQTKASTEIFIEIFAPAQRKQEH